MLFAQRFWPGITDGSIDLTFRRWKRVQVIAGNRYRTPAGIVQVNQVDVVDPQAITDTDARDAAGFSNAAELRAQLRGTEDQPVYRIAFQAVHEPDPRPTREHGDVDRRRRRRHRPPAHAARHGKFARRVDDGRPRMHRSTPGHARADLAASFGLETQPFKLDVRKLKNLGLTISLPRGYRLSPRGEAYLAGAGAVAPDGAA